MNEINLVVEIKNRSRDKFVEYLNRKDEWTILHFTTQIIFNEERDTTIFSWMDNETIKVESYNKYFSIDYEMEKTGIDPQDYVAELWTEDQLYNKCGDLEPSYKVIMKTILR